jgi:hypothetical protein
VITEVPGAAPLTLASNVVHLDPEPAMFSAMREGWARQQAARVLQKDTIGSRLRLVERMGEFTGLYPWQWTPADGEAFIADLRSGPRPIELSTARTYEVMIALFVEYLLKRASSPIPGGRRERTRTSDRRLERRSVRVRRSWFG